MDGGCSDEAWERTSVSLEPHYAGTISFALQDKVELLNGRLMLQAFISFSMLKPN